LKQYWTAIPGGFTLVETIVSIAIIGILAAVVVSTVIGKSQPIEANQVNSYIQTANMDPIQASFSGLTGQVDNITYDENIQNQAENASRRMELRIIQTAMDLMMVKGEMQIVNNTSFTSDMSAFPEGRPLYPKFLRESTSQYYYSCDSSGEVTQTFD
jgi:prepilin-type N-terminal cleavage/methylation domain-containing protein